MTETDWDEISADEAEAEGRIEEMETDLEREREQIVMASSSDCGFDQTVLPPVSDALRGWLRSQQAVRAAYAIEQWIQNGQIQNGKVA